MFTFLGHACRALPMPVAAAALREVDNHVLHLPKSARIDMARAWHWLPAEVREAVETAGGPPAVECASAWTEKYAAAAAVAVMTARGSRREGRIDHQPAAGFVADLRGRGPVVLVHPHVGANNLPQMYLASCGVDMVSLSTRPTAVGRAMRVVQQLSGIPVTDRLELINVSTFDALARAYRAMLAGKVFLWQPDSLALLPAPDRPRAASARLLGFRVSPPAGVHEIARRCGARVVVVHDTLLDGVRPRFRLTFEEIDPDISSMQGWYHSIYNVVNAVLRANIGQWRLLLGWIRTVSR